MLSNGSLCTDRGHHPCTVFGGGEAGLGPPVLEVTLTPGDILLVPMRLAVAVDSLDCDLGSVDCCVHLSSQVGAWLCAFFNNSWSVFCVNKLVFNFFSVFDLLPCR